MSITSGAANLLYSISGMVLTVGAILTLIGTIGGIWSGSIREKYAEERITANKKEAALANEKAALATEKTAELELEAENAKLEQQRLKELLAWRRLDRKSYETLVEGFRGITAKLSIGAVRADPESITFWEDILQAAKEAGIEVVPHTTWQRAVGLSITNSENPEAKRVFDAFRRAGFEISLSDEKGISGADFELTIGSKPSPF